MRDGQRGQSDEQDLRASLERRAGAQREAGRRHERDGSEGRWKCATREGAESPSAVALVGDEAHVLRRLEALSKLGVSDFNAILFPISGDPDAAQRTRDVLGAFAKGRTSP